MRAYFKKFLTSAWATKSEYFVLVGFLFGVVIAYLFSVPGVWAFTIGLAQIVGGFGVIFAVGVAVWQINILNSQAEEEIERKEKYAAMQAYGSIQAYDINVEVIAEEITSGLKQPEVIWEFENIYVSILCVPDNKVANEMKKFLDIFPELNLEPEAILLSARNPVVLRWERYIRADIQQIKRIFDQGAKWETPSLQLMQNRAAISAAQRLVRTITIFGNWLFSEYDVVDEPYRIVRTENERLSQDGWPTNQDLVELASANPPVDWGDWKETAEAAWLVAGNERELPVGAKAEVETS